METPHQIKELGEITFQKLQVILLNLQTIANLGLTVSMLSRDLHSPDCTYPAKNYTSEYEDKFSGEGEEYQLCEDCVSDIKIPLA